MPTSSRIPPATIQRLGEKLKGTTALGFEYPWSGLESSPIALTNGKLVLIGYGSLLNTASAARTVSDAETQEHIPVLAAGAQRVFNYLIPEVRLKSYGEGFTPREKAALNLVYSRDVSDTFNGRLLLVDAKDIPALRTREYGYNLMPVTAVRWGEWAAEPFVAYVLVAQQEQRNDRQVIDWNALPHPSYARLCRDGAKSVSEAFLQFYLESTFLADRKTTLAVWEKRNPGKFDNPPAKNP